MILSVGKWGVGGKGRIEMLATKTCELLRPYITDGPLSF